MTADNNKVPRRPQNSESDMVPPKKRPRMPLIWALPKATPTAVADKPTSLTKKIGV